MPRSLWTKATPFIPTLLFLATTLVAQEVRAPNRGGMTESLGLPRRVNVYAGPSSGAYLVDEHRLTAYGKLGLYKDIMNPLTGVLGFGIEGYGGFRGTEADGGV